LKAILCAGFSDSSRYYPTVLLFDFAIANNFSELINEVNHFCLPIFG